VAAALAALVRESFTVGASRVRLVIERNGDEVDPPDRIAERSTSDRPAGGRAPLDLNGALARMLRELEDELHGPLAALDRAAKQAAVRMLDERGAFTLRRSIEDVADALGVSRVTVYNYLEAIRQR
jgi:hypothetical protein